jgi:integrase/recombinase XerD
MDHEERSGDFLEPDPQRYERLREYQRRFLNKSPHEATRRAYRTALDQFQLFLRDRNRTLLDAAPEDVAAFRDFLTAKPRALKPKSVYMRLSALRSFYKGLATHGLIAENPANSRIVVPPKVSAAPITVTLSPVQIERLLSGPDRRTAAGARDYLVLCMLAKMALRAAEVCQLRHRDVVRLPPGAPLKSETGLYLVVDAQGRSRRLLPLGSEFKAALDAYLRIDAEERRLSKSNFADSALIQRTGKHRTLGGPPLTTRQLWNLARKYGDFAGIRDMHPHMFRHTAVVEAIRRGMSIEEVKALVGYRALETLYRYESAPE